MELDLGPGKSWNINQMIATFVTHVLVLLNFGLRTFPLRLHTLLVGHHV